MICEGINCVYMCSLSVSNLSLFRLCEPGGEQWGLADKELWCLQGDGPNEGLFSTEHGLQWRELTSFKIYQIYTNQPQSDTEMSEVSHFLDLVLLCSTTPPQLEVLHLLTPAQKAELLLRPEVASIDNGTLSLVFHSLLTGGSQPPTTLPPTSPGRDHNWMTTGYPPSYSPKLTYVPPPPQNSLQEVL